MHVIGCDTAAVRNLMLAIERCHLSIEAIVATVKTFQGRPTWEAIVLEVQARHGWSYTRQALSSRERIKVAVQGRRNGTRADADGKSVSAGAKAQAEERAVLLSKLRDRDALVERMTARFMLWVLNAFRHGLLEADLDEPISPATVGAPLSVPQKSRGSRSSGARDGQASICEQVTRRSHPRGK